MLFAWAVVVAPEAAAAAVVVVSGFQALGINYRLRRGISSRDPCAVRQTTDPARFDASTRHTREAGRETGNGNSHVHAADGVCELIESAVGVGEAAVCVLTAAPE